MISLRGPQASLIVGFVALIAAPSLIQTCWELAESERPRVLEVFDQPPTARNLHAFERDIEDSSLVVKRLRPPMQYAQYMLLGDAGEKAVLGRDGWLFYRPGVRYLIEREAETIASRAPAADPLPAILSFRDQLRARGIELSVMIVPDKESIYPEKLSRRAEGSGVIICARTRLLLEQLKNHGIDVVNLFEEFGRAKQESSRSRPPSLYLVQDSHWTSEGARLAAGSVGKRIIKRGWVMPGSILYEERTVQVRRLGDVIQMLQVPRLERAIEPELITCMQVAQADSKSLYRDEADSRVLVLGDSFLRIYERDEPGSAGFIAHLARELQQPLTSIVSDGGASTVVRQELARRPQLLSGKKLVIWEFVERDIGEGTEGWQVLPLARPPRGSG
jgi:hypothetical protein